MTGRERIVKAESILRRQKSGKITPAQASAEFDALLDAESGDLHFMSDTTCKRGERDGVEFMILTSAGGDLSNTGLIVQGARRGELVKFDDGRPEPHPEQVAHFRELGAK